MTSPLRLSLFFYMFFLPHIALAHSPIKGIGDFLNGMVHPLLVPAQVLVILALGLWYGQHQPAKNKASVLIFLFATVSGLVTSGFSATGDVSVLLLVGASSLGLLIISGISVPQVVFILSGIFTGFIVGLDSFPEGADSKANIVSLFGSGVSIYFMLLYAMALSESLSDRQWKIIVVRVIASWLSASALMVLALGFS